MKVASTVSDGRERVVISSLDPNNPHAFRPGSVKKNAYSIGNTLRTPSFQGGLDAGFGQFIAILSWVCGKQGVYFEKVNKDYTSQVCPNCDTHTGKKELDDRVHNCPECGYRTHRDVAAAQVIRFSRIIRRGTLGRYKRNCLGRRSDGDWQRSS